MKTASRAETASPVGATLVTTPPDSRARTLPQQGSLTLWLWVAAGFLLLALAWAALFTAAKAINVERVPLATKGGGTR